MAKPALATVLHCLHRALGLRAADDLSDAELLGRFVAAADHEAFAALTRRHGRLVWNVCLRVLGNPHDAEDAFQAVFLVLARKAHAVGQPHLLGNWLHGVALRCAHKWKQQANARRLLERKAVAMLADDATDDQEWSDLRPVLDEEVQRLPASYRAPVVLVYFEGKPYEEAARLLGCPPGTVAGRLARARALLRERLTRRGLGVSLTLLTLVLSENVRAEAAPAALLANTIDAGLLYSGGDILTTGMISSNALNLAEGVMRTMFLTKVKILTLLAVVLGLAGGTTLLQVDRLPVEAPAIAADTTARSASPESAWTDLASADEATVTRAVLTLAKTPAETLAFLKQNLPPVKADPKRVTQLVADLDSNQFATRQRAAEELEYQGKYIKDDLEKSLAAAQGIETKQRLQQLVDKLPKPAADPKALPQPKPGQGASVQVINNNGQQRIIINGVEIDPNPRPAAGPAGPSSTWIRAVRAIALLEHLGTPEARAVLENIASGESEALPTQQARAALDRLKK